jgi:hypothetical protein
VDEQHDALGTIGYCNIGLELDVSNWNLHAVLEDVHLPSQRSKDP